MSTTRNVNIDLNANGQDDQNGQQGYNPDGNVNISSQVPEQFKGSTNSELIDWLEKKIDERKPMSNEDLEKLRKKQKAEGIISGISDAVMSISNLLTTTRYAPNIESASKGVMSDAAKARWDKAKAEREAEDEEYFNLAMKLATLKGQEQDRGLQIWNTEQNLARQDRNHADDVAFRNKDFDERVRQWQAGFDRDAQWHEEEGQRWERQFTESVRQFNVSQANERARINLQAQQLAQQVKQGQMTFNLGSGNGNVTLSMDQLNAQTISRIYQTLPPEVRSKVQGEPVVQNGMVVSYKPPTTEAMLIAIGANVETSPATQNAIKQVAGLEKGDKPAGY